MSSHTSSVSAYMSVTYYYKSEIKHSTQVIKGFTISKHILGWALIKCCKFFFTCFVT